ncbi:MAG: DUF4149 domain-containing protein [Pseudomonadota bacterium]
MTITVLTALVMLLSAAAIGTMVYFGAGVAPVLFKTLDEEKAGKLIRALFPVYYMVLAGLTGLAGALAMGVDPTSGFIMLMVAFTLVFARQVMMPRINDLRDKAKTGSVMAQQAFDRAHSWSVRLNMIQLAALVLAFGVFALRAL